VVAAHPDDETLSCGGTIARLAGSGCDVYVIIVVCHETNWESTTAKPETEGLTRSEELKHACHILGVAGYEILIHAPVSTSLNDEHARLVHMIESGSEFSIERLKPQMLLIPAHGAFHQDHRVTHAAGLSAARDRGQGHADAPRIVWGFAGPEDSWSSSATARTVSLDVTDYHGIKTQALDAYRAQLRGASHPRSIEGVCFLDRAAGIRNGSQYAEEYVNYRTRL
jgi:LmbE family N-acetylglucosaminyl deacetylase